jgi:transposase
MSVKEFIDMAGWPCLSATEQKGLDDILSENHRAGSGGPSNRGGRRHFLMSLEDELNFLDSLSEQVNNGQELTVKEIHSMVEKKVGTKVVKSTTYRMLKRHGWVKEPSIKLGARKIIAGSFWHKP